LPLYALASGHYVQQLYFVYRHQKRTRPLPYLVAMTLLGGAVALVLTAGTVGVRALAGSERAIPPWVAAMIGINLWHYWIESRIWRRPSFRRSVPRVAESVVAKI